MCQTNLASRNGIAWSPPWKILGTFFADHLDNPPQQTAGHMASRALRAAPRALRLLFFGGKRGADKGAKRLAQAQRFSALRGD